jgi:hypothetical protein
MTPTYGSPLLSPYVDQFDFILRCGGLGRSLETILHVIRGQY